MPGFKDHFSRQAELYSTFRPTYPSALFDYLSSLAPDHTTAWDCATGTGQAAVALTNYFERVIATDPSAEQLRHARRHPRIDYRLAAAEQTDIAASSIQLVTVAQALHWFDFERFYEEVARVLEPSGVIAVWSYTLCEIAPEIDQCISAFYGDVLGPYWPPERCYVDDGYRSMPFPFQELRPPPFDMTAEWSLDHLCGYLSSWSAVQRYKDETSRDPVPTLRRDLAMMWGQSMTPRRVRWPLRLRVGRV